jgi:hypothetical protein
MGYTLASFHKMETTFETDLNVSCDIGTGNVGPTIPLSFCNQFMINGVQVSLTFNVKCGFVYNAR